MFIHSAAFAGDSGANKSNTLSELAFQEGSQIISNCLHSPSNSFTVIVLRAHR